MNPLTSAIIRIAEEASTPAAKNVISKVAGVPEQAVKNIANNATRMFKVVPTQYGDEAISTIKGKDGKLYSAKLNLNHENWGGQHLLELSHNGKDVGSFAWNAVPDDEIGLTKGMVAMVDVYPEFQRKGLATDMWNIANDAAKQFNLAAPVHSPHLTPEGRAWIDALTRMAGNQ